MFQQFGFHDIPFQGSYIVQLRCYSAIMLPMGGSKGSAVDRGGKIILPQSALDLLTRLHIQFPMLFKLTNKSKNRVSHSGVLEFSAEEGRCYIPHWMMKNMLLAEGDLIQIEYINLPIAKFVKFQPQSADFLEIANPKAVLENALRNFATLTKDDVISIFYNDKDYEIRVLETKPGNAVSIIECDMDVDFAPPVGYVEPDYKKNTAKQAEADQAIKYPTKKDNKTPYYGEGYRLDGKAKRPEQIQSSQAQTSSSSALNEPQQRGIPNYEYIIGELTFNRNPSKKDQDAQKDDGSKTKEIKGHRLRDIGTSSKKL